MRKSLKRCMALALCAAMAVGSLTGCKSEEKKPNADPTTAPTQQTGGDENKTNSDKPYEGVVLQYAVAETATQGGEAVEIVNLVKEKTGIILDFKIVPNTNAGEVDKTLVQLQAGDNIDIIYGTTQKLKTYYNAGVLTPLDEYAKNTGYDMKKVFGDSLPIYDDGNTYGLPAFNDIWLTFYNKKIFDDAGVPYPSAEGWTWEKYVETAKKLTNIDKDIWGSFMLDYDNYNYMWATQAGAQPYKADGTSNFDDPLYAKGLEFFYNLGKVEKIQPDSITYASGAYPWNSFVASGNFGMFVCGGWVASMLPNEEKYPRDWECGILPMPYPEGSDPSTLVVTGCYAVASTSKNKEAAFEAVKCIAENQYTLGYGRIPARIDLSEAEISDYISKNLVPTYEKDKITEEDFRNAWFDVNRKVLPEKIIGTADTVISQIWIDESGLYGQGSQSLEKTMQNLKERSDAAIKEELSEN